MPSKNLNDLQKNQVLKMKKHRPSSYLLIGDFFKLIPNLAALALTEFIVF